MKSCFNFENKNVLVSGSSNGIGWESARLLALNGGNITLVARNEELLKKRLKQLHNNGSQHHNYVVLDFLNPNRLESHLKEFTKKNAIAFDIIINNTGGPPGGELQSASTDELWSAFNLHLISFHKILGVLLPEMKKKESGRIINVISTSVKQPLNGLGVSNTIRGAVANWSKTLANELGEYNITVNNVLPGATNTGRLNEIISNKASKLNIREQQVKDDMAAEVPMKRIAEPEEVAYAILFLASEYASYINGINLPVDGGRTKSL